MTVSFWAGNPRNDLMVMFINCITCVYHSLYIQTGKTFLTVECKTNDSDWEILYTDASWETKYNTNSVSCECVCVITQQVPVEAHINNP